MTKLIGASLGIIALGAFAGLIQKWVRFGSGDLPYSNVNPLPYPDLTPAAAEPAIPTPVLPPSPTETMSVSDTATVQALLSGENVVNPYVAVGVPDVNPNYIPAALSDWAALPAWMNNQIADYSSPNGGWIMYNGSKYWVNNRNLAPTSLWIK